MSNHQVAGIENHQKESGVNQLIFKLSHENFGSTIHQSVHVKDQKDKSDGVQLENSVLLQFSVTGYRLIFVVV